MMAEDLGSHAAGVRGREIEVLKALTYDEHSGRQGMLYRENIKPSLVQWAPWEWFGVLSCANLALILSLSSSP